MVSIERSKKNGQFYARITGGNNKKLNSPETMKSKASVRNNLRAIYIELAKVFEFGKKIVDNTKPKPKKKKRVKTNMILG